MTRHRVNTLSLALMFPTHQRPARKLLACSKRSCNIDGRWNNFAIQMRELLWRSWMPKTCSWYSRIADMDYARLMASDSCDSSGRFLGWKEGGRRRKAPLKQRWTSV